MLTESASIYCLSCGYNLRGLPECRCPECGRLFDPNDPASFAASRAEFRIRTWLKRSASAVVFVPLIWLGYLIQAPAEIVFSLLAFGIVLIGRQRRWASITALLLFTPATYFFGLGLAEYAKGEGAIWYMGYPGVSANNISPTYRCERRTGGCVIRGGESLRIIPHNAALRLAILTLGPIRGSYTGPYPTKKEALKALETAEEIPILSVFSELIMLHGVPIKLKSGLAEELLGRYVWFIMNDEPNRNLWEEEIQMLPRVTGVLYQHQCLVIGVPFGCGVDEPCGRISLIDTETGKLFAHYGETGNEPSNPVLRWFE